MTRSRARMFRNGGVRFGAAYYAEYQPTPRLDEDLDLMAAAGFSVIRVGESVWSTWEPRDGEFDLEWLLPVLDGAHRRDIDVILGTPTYAVPPWLQKAHPEIAAERATGRAVPWGARQEVDFTHPVFRDRAERVIRAIVSRYAEHPAVAGFQLDNEPGLELLHNAHVFDRFVADLAERYGDVETLNREWGLTYWSHRIDQWDELWRPDGNTVPQYDLAWRRFQADLVTEFIHWQAGIVESYRRADQFLTTCIAYSRPAIDDEQLVAGLDVAAGNVYHGSQDHLGLVGDLPSPLSWTTSGVWGLYRQADRLFSSAQDRFLVTETNAASIAGSDHNQPPYPGQLRQCALALVSRGAAMIEYWHWHSLHFGAETYWGGILPHSQRPGRIYREIADLGAEIRAIGDVLHGYEPDADIALLWSSDSAWALEFSPPLQTVDHQPDRASYSRVFDAFYRGVIEAGAQARVLHTGQAERLGAAALAERHPVLVVPALYAATDAQLEMLRDYAVAGGHLMVGIRTGYGDHEARARRETAPAVLGAPAGIWYDEFTNLGEPVALTTEGGFPLSPGSRALAWADGLVTDGADVLIGYDHPQLSRFAAVTTARVGRGRITYVGTVPNASLARDLMNWVAPVTVSAPWLDGSDGAVTVASGAVPDGRRVWFLHNWSSDPAHSRTPHAVRDLVSGADHAAGTPLTLDPWSCLVLADG